MYNPLVEIVHKSGAITYVRALSITGIEKRREDDKSYGDFFWKVKTKDNSYLNVVNVEHVLNIVSEAENRNELTKIMGG